MRKVQVPLAVHLALQELKNAYGKGPIPSQGRLLQQKARSLIRADYTSGDLDRLSQLFSQQGTAEQQTIDDAFQKLLVSLLAKTTEAMTPPQIQPIRNALFREMLVSNLMQLSVDHFLGTNPIPELERRLDKKRASREGARKGGESKPDHWWVAALVEWLREQDVFEPGEAWNRIPKSADPLVVEEGIKCATVYRDGRDVIAVDCDSDREIGKFKESSFKKRHITRRNLRGLKGA
jgi:hypothetical protein